MKYDLIVVGMGPSAAFLAYELIELNNYKNVLLIDQGKSVSKRVCPMEKAGKCLNCKPYCNITCGFSGAGAFSDGQLHSYHLSSRDSEGKIYLGGNDGGYIRQYISEEEICDLLSYTDDVYLKYKPSPLGTYYTTRTLYYNEEEGEIVDDKPKYGYYETYRVGTVLKVYKWLDWYQEWDFYQNSTYEEFSTMIEKIILVTNKGKHLFTYNDIYELQDEECAWIESKWDKELREVK